MGQGCMESTTVHTDGGVDNEPTEADCHMCWPEGGLR